MIFFFFSSRRRHTRCSRDWSSDVCSSDLNDLAEEQFNRVAEVTYEIRKAEAIPYLETTRTMNKYGKIRAVVIESGRDKKRAAIYTNGTAEELGAERIVQLICRRWGEENAIKELLHKHLINYTP